MTKNYLIRLATVLILLKVVSSIESDLTQVHKLLSPKERLRIFGTDDENEVPEYDIIHINWSKHQKRSIDGIVPLSLSVFNDDIYLNLKRLSPLVGPKTPVYHFRTSSNGLLHTIDYLFANYTADIYEDENLLASLTVNMKPNGEKYIETGVIKTHNLTIHRIPSRYLIEKKRPMIKVQQEYYIVQQMNNSEGVFADPVMSNYSSPDLFNSSIPELDVIYPEILVLLDYSLKDNFMNNDELLTYVLTFWSRVDMLYRNFTNPKYKLSIAGVAIAEDMTAFEFMNEKFVNNDLHDIVINYNTALYASGKWLFDRQNIIPINSYDVAFIQTSIRANKTSQFGAAVLRGACYVDYENAVIGKVGIVYDDGRYSTVLTYIAAHELGHTLGAQHDEEECGKVDAKLIMSAVLQSPILNPSKWSPCTAINFGIFLMTNPECLYNIPDQYKDLEPNSSDDEKVPVDFEFNYYEIFNRFFRKALNTIGTRISKK